MSPVKILPASCPFDLSSSFTFSDTFTYSENTNWSSDIIAHDLLSSSPFIHISSDSSIPENHGDDGENIFSSLPPLFGGHPGVHLRNGIMKSSRMAAADVTNAEKAFFVADLGQVYRQHERWRKHLPKIEPHYAIKCNPDPYVLRLLAALGAGFDCASNGEINQVFNIGGIDPSRIIFANPCKATSFIRSAEKVGVDQMTFDNADELYKIARVHPSAKLIIRILADDSKSVCRFGIKFGARLEVVPSLLAKAKELNMNVIGVSFHVGSGCYDPTIYEDAIRRSRDVFEMGARVGYKFSLLDVGGGFEDARFEQAASVLTEAIDRYFPDRGDIRMIAEPGRFYVSKAFSLAVNVIARRTQMAEAQENVKLDLECDQPSAMYYINDGVYGAFNCIMFDHQTVHPYVLSLNGSFHIGATEPVSLSSLWGPTCDSIDCVSKSVLLPSRLDVGDWLGFDNMGAYTICASSQFNGFELSDVIYTTGGGAGGGEVRKVLAVFADQGYGHK